MKCATCKWWSSQDRSETAKLHAECVCPKLKSADKDGAIETPIGKLMMTGPDFGCTHWKYFQLRGNYKPESAHELQVRILQSENDAAANRIALLSKVIHDLGFDPTTIKP